MGIFDRKPNVGKLAAKRDVKALVKVLKYKNDEVRREAKKALANFGEVGLLALIEALKSEDGDMRFYAACALRDIGGEATAPTLIEALKDEREDVRIIAAYSLRDIGGEAAVPALIEALKDKACGVHDEAVNSLAKIGKPAVPALIDALQDENEYVRERVATVLWRIGLDAKAAAPTLMEALWDENSIVRMIAGLALCKIRPNEAAVPALIEALKSTDKDAWSDAIKALEEIGEAAVPALIEVLKDKGREGMDMRARAALILRSIHPDAKRAVPTFIEALKDVYSNAREIAISALVNYGEAAVPALIEALKDKERGMRFMAAIALGEIGDKAAMPALRKALEDKEEVMRHYAAEALNRIGGKAAEALGKIEGEKENFVPYSHKQMGFSFEHPMGWHKEFSRGKLLVYPSDAKTISVSGEVMLSPCITMLISERTAESPPQSQFYKAFLSEQHKNFEKYKLLWDRPFKLSNGEEALEWSFEFVKESHYFIAVSIMAIKRDRIFLLDGSCLRSQFENLEPALSKVIRSLSLQ